MKASGLGDANYKGSATPTVKASGLGDVNDKATGLGDANYAL